MKAQRARSRVVVSILVTFFAGVPLPWARADGGDPKLEAIRAEYFAARHAFAMTESSEDAGDWEANYRAKLDPVWRAVEDWACILAARQPDADGDAMASWIDSLDPVSDCGEVWSPCFEENHLEAWSVRLEGIAPPGWVIAYDYPGAGSFSILVRDPRSGACSVAFRARSFEVPRRFDEGDAACLTGDPAKCRGDVIGFSVETLPPTGRGEPRFWADGFALGGGSCEHYRQASVWTWSQRNGAVLDALVPYGQSCDHSRSSGFDADSGVLRLVTKEFAKSYFSPGSSPQPEGEHALRITPWGVDDLGVRWLVPELELVDRFIDAVGRHTSPDDLATRAAIDWLRRYLFGGEDPLYDPHATLEEHIGLGMGDANVIERKEGRVEVCLEADGIAPDHLQLTLTEKDGRQRITRVRVSSCEPG